MNKDKIFLIEQIEKEIKHCQKCILCSLAKNSVPGEGNINAEIVFIGEAPGATEDELGRPFVGRAGKLLDGLLKALKIDRSEVWIGNIVKHRPPKNRDPLTDEIKACEGYLTRQLDIINPLLVITLGRFSMNYFYPDGKISRDHGNLLKLGKYNVFPVYHPAAALRNGNMFEALKKDFAKIPSMLRSLKEVTGKDTYDKSIKNLGDEDNQLGLDL